MLHLAPSKPDFQNHQKKNTFLWLFLLKFIYRISLYEYIKHFVGAFDVLGNSAETNDGLVGDWNGMVRAFWLV